MKIERYAQIITAIVSTLVLLGLVVMVAVPTALYVVHRLTGNRADIRIVPGGRERAGQTAAARLKYGSPILTDQSDYVMVPVWLEGATAAGAGAMLKSYAFSSYAGSYSGVSKSAWVYYGCSGRPFHNLVFRHKQTGESHLLLEKPAVISRCYFPYERSRDDEPPPPKFLLLGISDQDTNHDGVIDENDAIVGYMADLAGRHLQQVTPPQTQLLDWDIDRSRRVVYLRVRGDTDHDGKFTEKDEEWILQVAADQPAIGEPVVSDALREQLRHILLH